MVNRLPPVPWLTHSASLVRSRQIIAVLTRHGLGWVLTRLGSEITSWRHLKAAGGGNLHLQASELRQALIELGATFVKLGQALSSRADLLPPEFVEELSKLQDDIQPAPFEKIKAVLESELGMPIEEAYGSFDPQPIASASIGQVYAAKLKNGQEVAVKVIRPGVAEKIKQDLDLLYDIADWAANHTTVGKFYDLPALVDEFAFTVRNELDYQREGHNADVFRRNFHGDPRVYIPRIYWDLTTRQVITIERVKGLKINDVAGLDESTINRKVVAENLMHFALRQIFEFNFYHADPHAGNFFVQPDGSLAVMDFGMVGHLSNNMKNTLLGLALAIQRHDPDLLVDEFLAAGIYTRGINRKAFTREVTHLMDTFSSGRLEDISAQSVTNDVLGIALRNGLQLPSELVAMIRAVTIAEGIGTFLYPGFRMIEFAAPYLRHFGEEQRSPKVLLPRLGQATLDGLELGIDLPRRVNRLLGQLERGQFEVRINLDVLQQFMAQMQRMTNRLALTVLLGATIIALGMVMVVYHPTAWQRFGQYVFAFAFISSVAFGAWLMWSIIRSGRT